jgi:hypothetical protein
MSTNLSTKTLNIHNKQILKDVMRQMDLPKGL